MSLQECVLGGSSSCQLFTNDWFLVEDPSCALSSPRTSWTGVITEELQPLDCDFGEAWLCHRFPFFFLAVVGWELSPLPSTEAYIRKLGTRILLPPALLSKQQDSPQLPQWIVNPFRTTQAHQTRSVLFT